MQLRSYMSLLVCASLLALAPLTQARNSLPVFTDLI